MSTLKVDSITNDGSAVDFTYNAKVGNGTLKKEYYEQDTEPAYPCDGALWFNTSDDTFHIYANNAWYATTVVAPLTVWYGSRGVFAGGQPSPRFNVIEYITIASTGNATDFGDLSAAKSNVGAVSNSVRGVFAGGAVQSVGDTNTMEYITIATTGNVTDFGDLTAAKQTIGASNAERGVFASLSSASNVLEYITIATTGNGTDFGDLTSSRSNTTAASGSVRALFAGGYVNPNRVDTIDYITIATTGDATDFGNLLAGNMQMAACSDTTRCLFAGGFVSSSSDFTRINVIQYVTTATTGNATDFGDLLSGISRTAGTSNGVRGVFGGGYDGSNELNTIQYVTIQTPGNATDFGDLTAVKYEVGACSGN